MSEEMAAYQGGAIVNFEEYAMSVDSVVRQVNLVQEIMSQVMKLDEHYGTIPGCKKPSLYKPGAEKLGFTFRLAPEYDVRTINMPNGHREYQVKCRLRHIPTGSMVGEGEGSCTTMEGKYRFRGGEKEGTGQAIPKEYWNLKNAGKTSDALDLIGGPGFLPGKVDGKWEICSVGEKVEHDNPADYYNTCLKMAKKRAHVDAILTATAASDIFTQDVEDMPEVIPRADKEMDKKKPPTSGPAPQSKSGDKKDDTRTDDEKITEKRERIRTMLDECFTEQDVKDDFIKTMTSFNDFQGYNGIDKIRYKPEKAVQAWSILETKIADYHKKAMIGKAE